MAKPNLPSIMRPASAAQLIANAAADTGGRKVAGPYSGVSPQSWGNAGDMLPPWQENERRNILDIRQVATPTQPAWRCPYTQSIVLAAELPNSMVGAYLSRWIVEVGAGSGRTRFVVDGSGVQQITLPAETIRILYQLVAMTPSIAFESPNMAINYAAFVADGTTATESPTYTQYWRVPLGQKLLVPAPFGATGFRIGGVPGNVNSPFTANTVFNCKQSGMSDSIESYPGDYLLPIRHEIIPFSGQCNQLEIFNIGNAVAANVWVIWSLDL